MAQSLYVFIPRNIDPNKRSHLIFDGRIYFSLIRREIVKMARNIVWAAIFFQDGVWEEAFVLRHYRILRG